MNVEVLVMYIIINKWLKLFHQFYLYKIALNLHEYIKKETTLDGNLQFS